MLLLAGGLFNRYKMVRSRSKTKSRLRSVSETKSPKPRDPVLYAKVKARVYKNIPKHSAYRSGIVVQEYKKAYARAHSYKSNPYKGERKPKKGLARWFKEKWRNQRGEVGYSKPGDVYRPTKRITNNTPATFRELSWSRLRRASNEKKRTGRVKRF